MKEEGGVAVEVVLKRDGSSIMAMTGFGVVGRLGDLERNAGSGTGFGDTRRLESLAARLGVKSPSDDSNEAELLARLLFGVDSSLPGVGEGASASV